MTRRAVIGLTAERMRLAIANDNQGQWFLAASTTMTAVALEQRFKQQLVSRALYQRVGGILQGPEPYLYIQIALIEDVCTGRAEDGAWIWEERHNADAEMPEWAVQTSLRDLNVWLIRPINLQDVILSVLG